MMSIFGPNAFSSCITASEALSDYAKRESVNAQDQRRVLKAGDTMSGDLVMDGALVRGLPKSPPTAYVGDEAVSWAQAQEVATDAASDAVVSRVAKGGDTMTGDLNMDGALVRGLPTTNPRDTYEGDEAVSWAQAQRVATEATEDVVTTCVAKSGDTMAGDLNMDGALVRGLPTAYPPDSYAGDEAVSWAQAQQAASEAAATCVAKSGGTLAGDLNMDGALVRGLPMAFPPSSYTGDEAVSWVQAQLVAFDAAQAAGASCVAKSGDRMSGNLDMSGNSITAVADPSDPQDVATKNYADRALSHKATVPASPITNGVAVVKADGMALENHNFTATSASDGGAYVTIGGLATDTGTDPSHQSTPLTINDRRPNGGNTPGSLTDILQLRRSGVGRQAYGNIAKFKLGRYENVRTHSRTRLQLSLSHDAVTDTNSHESPVITWDSSGRTKLHGTLMMSGNRISGLAHPLRDQDVATKSYVDTRVEAYVNSLLMRVFPAPASTAVVGDTPVDILQARLPTSWLGRTVVLLASVHISPTSVPPVEATTSSTSLWWRLQVASGVAEAAEKSGWLPAPTTTSPTSAYLYQIEAAIVVQPTQANINVALSIVTPAGSLTITDAPPHQTRLMAFLAA